MADPIIQRPVYTFLSLTRVVLDFARKAKEAGGTFVHDREAGTLEVKDMEGHVIVRAIQKERRGAWITSYYEPASEAPRLDASPSVTWSGTSHKETGS